MQEVFEMEYAKIPKIGSKKGSKSIYEKSEIPKSKSQEIRDNESNARNSAKPSKPKKRPEMPKNNPEPEPEMQKSKPEVHLNENLDKFGDQYCPFCDNETDMNLEEHGKTCSNYLETVSKNICPFCATQIDEC